MNNSNLAINAASNKTVPTPHLQRFQTRDIDEHGRNLGGWQVRYDQLTPGSFEGELTEFRSDWLQLVRDRSNQALNKSGVAWKGAIVFALPLSANGPAFCAGHVLPASSMIVAHGDNLPELSTPPQLDALGVIIEEGALANALERQGSRFEITDLPKCYRLTDPTVRTRFAALFDNLLNGEQACLQKLEYASIRQGIRDAVMLQVLELVTPDQVPPLNPTARKRMVDRARDYTLAHLDEPLSILDVCNHIGTSRRKLQYCFQETLGINPVAFLRTLRLNAARRELRESPRTELVQTIAARWGFWHLSRFSSDYRTLFGETPSQTLQRTHLC
ncbi:Transcriptional regulator, AraC family [Pseudomonas syringae pv. helianthi]|uniref:Transcriptional regulator, AraC family n=1 Tax=Pseudomonas syringae pv. helianthi TaxID=251654 RepID=A0A0P9R369_9PSED|nr:helix-turn-helix domain-containing protein [Pseudomonas syringae group genomosp. 7]KPX39610.1 Transcriptional regulator, AraC family [Pseudomonas syringae pv. helianthi]UNB64157.1 helix-turn-helix domain-containing protein [Pseudomonas syringae pv. helianthi]